MFKPEYKYVFKPYRDWNNDWRVKPVEGLEYLDWRVVDRWLECVCDKDFVVFNFVELRVMERKLPSDLWEQISQNYEIFSATFYPEPYSDNWVLIYALADHQLRGVAEETAVANLFTYYLRDNFDNSQKLLCGRYRAATNPISGLFPEFWAWWQDMKRKTKEAVND